ncbi:hypothetical protein CEXT_621701 [Caerostris extrusa]|uniref:Uncharacterized protein n=1 Tax=Caerostris extrusa TaxID=172846 RepID=A0AAV4TH07_CAEEX|nr:hypothetical protein CEXT_621701 [Caerostris extrusa]
MHKCRHGGLDGKVPSRICTWCYVSVRLVTSETPSTNHVDIHQIQISQKPFKEALFAMPCLGYYAISVRSIQQILKTHPINRGPRVIDAPSSMADFLARIIEEDTTLGYCRSVCSSGCG